jgi:hypothetical protein
VPEAICESGNDDVGSLPIPPMNDPISIPRETPCSVCGRAVTDPAATNLCFVTLEPADPMKLREPELSGTCVEVRFVTTPLRTWAFYTPRNSLARKAGFDLLFLSCSEACGVKLAEATIQDTSMFSKLILQ